ncbi:uncharacterized protein METZ01_LOCUS146255 [marine metagenome]|uniref:Uncharacterized protein n=1 Tax=marine metagenome TaxID=408172 RepID=A0A381ZWP5_9ZZZZ
MLELSGESILNLSEDPFGVLAPSHLTRTVIMNTSLISM